MRRNKIYITNNKNIHDIGGFNIPNINGLSFPVQQPVQQQPIRLNLDPSDLKPLENVQQPKKSGFNIGSLSSIGAGAALDALENAKIPGTKRGLYDAADPLYWAADGNETAVGNAFSDVGVGLFKSSAQQGNFAGMAVGGAVKGVGSLINALWGTSVDEEKLNRARQGTNYLDAFNQSVTSNDDLQNIKAVRNVEDAYSGGLFMKGWARRRNALLKEDRSIANARAYNSLGNSIDNIYENQIAQGLRNYAAFGGPLHSYGSDWSNDITIVNNGGSHESNPYEGVPMGIAPDNTPNLVEEGEVIFNDYVFSKRLKIPREVQKQYKLGKSKDMTFADAAKKAQKESEERPNDPISQRGLEDIMNRLMIEQEIIRATKNKNEYSMGGKIHIAPSKRGTFTAAASKHGMGVQEFASKVLANPEDYSPAMRKKANFARNASKWKHALGGPIKPFDIPEHEYGKYVYKFDDTFEPKQYKPTPISIGEKPLEFAQQSKSRWFNPATLRYAPVLGSAVGLMQNLFTSPDYSDAESITDVARDSANNVRNVSFNPIGNYLTYRPLDRLFYTNMLQSNTAATRRAILNNSGANRASAIAAMLALDYNTGNQLGNLARQAEEYNFAQRQNVEEFNRGTNMFNSEGLLKADMANMSKASKNAELLTNAAIKRASMRDSIKERRGNALSANLTNLFDNLGNIGRESYIMDIISNNPYLLYDWLGKYKWASKARGGYLTIKRRR